MKGMRQFVQHGVRMFGPLTWIKQPSGSRNMDMFFQARVVAIGNQPTPTRVILHVAKFVVPIDLNAELAQPGKAIWRHDVGDALQVIGKCFERLLADFLIGWRKRLGID